MLENKIIDDKKTKKSSFCLLVNGDYLHLPPKTKGISLRMANIYNIFALTAQQNQQQNNQNQNNVQAQNNSLYMLASQA